MDGSSDSLRLPLVLSIAARIEPTDGNKHSSRPREDLRVGGLDEEPFMNLRAVGELRPPLTEDEPGIGAVFQPRMLQFCRHFARGALLSVCWSEVDDANCPTGRDIIMCYPLYFEKSVR